MIRPGTYVELDLTASKASVPARQIPFRAGDLVTIDGCRIGLVISLCDSMLERWYLIWSCPCRRVYPYIDVRLCFLATLDQAISS